MKITKWNDGWKFWSGGDSFALVWNIPDTALDVTLPHDAMTLETPDKDSPNGTNTGFINGALYTYVKRFEAPADEFAAKDVIVRFEGIYEKASIYVNEQMVGNCNYGYSTVDVNITGALKLDAENEIRVIVRNGAMPNSRWYSGGGIYRDVYLCTGTEAEIPLDGVHIDTKTVEESVAEIVFKTRIQNKVNARLGARLITEIVSPDGNTVARDNVPAHLMPLGESELVRRVTVAKPSAWSEENPAMYRCISRLVLEDGKELDSNEESFGIRTLALDSVHGLRVNGQTVKLRGACIHHDSGLLGAATYDDVMYRQVKRMKDAGFNALRISHNPAAPALLRACDRLGVYVMDEFADMWTRNKSDYDYSMSFATDWQKDVRSMVMKDYNHPSVIMYSIGNEIPEIGTDYGAGIGNDISTFIKSIDSTRYTTAGINGVFASGDRMGEIMHDITANMESNGEEGGNVNDFMTVMDSHMDDIVTHRVVSERLDNACAALDIAGYNYMTARYEKDYKENPGRIIVGSETYPPEIARNWAEIEKYSTVIGDFTWTGWDYIGEAGIGIPAYKFGEGGFGAGFPSRLAYSGDIDITGFRRPVSYFREIVFGLRKAPYIAVQNPHHYGEKVMKTPWVMSDSIASWTWDVAEGSKVVVEVYSAGDEVELLLNDRSVGRQAAGKNVGFRTYFETVYEKGELLAVSYENGTEIGRMPLVTAGEVSKLSVLREMNEKLSGDGELSDIIYLDLALCDNEGNVNTEGDREISIEVPDNIELLGFGSADPKDVSNYLTTDSRTFNGRAQLVVRKKDDKSAEIKIKADDIITEYSL